MKKYNDRDNTPLRFHNFLKNVSFPLGLVYYSIVIIYNLVVYGIESIATLLIIDYACMVAAIVLIIIALHGLSKWKYSAWKCTVGLFIMTLTYNVIYLAILTVFNLSGDGETIMEALQSLIISPFILVYYFKRKALFTEGKENSIKGTHILGEDIVRNMDLPISKNETPEVAGPVVVEQKEIVCVLDEKIKEKKLKIRFCKFCGGRIDAQTKKCNGCGKQYFKGIKFNKFFTTVLILSLVIISSIIFNIVQLVETNELNADIEYYRQKSSEQQTEISSLNKEIKEKDNTLDFFDRHVVFVEDDGSKLYHKYGCYKFNGKSFWAFNIEAAKGDGYFACSECSPGKTTSQTALDKLRKKYGLD